MNAPSAWFEDETTLLAELRRSRGAVTDRPRINGYEIVCEIKRGGQGAVYEAVQRSTRRRVAVKVLLDASYYSRGGRRRFEREVDLAAGLRHPNIVRVYDSGVTEDGRAYLVMEYAEGVSLEEYAQSVGRDARRVLEVFVQVCEGVQHAHTRGVIHRDLKPGNVRVDTDGAARVLDFGLAKQRTPQPDGAEAARTLTTTGQFLGSLAWASPEQARGEHDRVDIRTDVYSLGVMLYQLLTGTFPYDVSGPLHQSLGAIVNTPATPVRKHRPDLDEQVEVILATALKKEPQQRYQSAGELAEDVRHHLRGEPIRARRESTWRGLQRTVRRYRTIGAVGGAALALVSVLSVVAVVQARSADRERAAAQAQAARAENTLTFLRDLLSSARPSAGGQGIATRVVDVVDRASETVDAQFADDTRTLGTLHELLGELYVKLDQNEKGLHHHARSVEIYQAMPASAERESDLLRARASVGSTHISLGKYEDAVRELESVRDERARRGEERTEAMMMTLSDLGMALRRLGRLEESRATFERAFANLPDGVKQKGSYFSLLNNYANLRLDMGDNGEAERMFREHLRLRVLSEGESSGETIVARSNLGVLLLNLGRHQEALEVLEPALEPARKVLGPDHITTLILLNNIGTAQMRLGRSEEAIATLNEALALHRAKGPANDRYIIAPLGNLLGALADLKRYDEAAEAGREGYEVAMRVYGERTVDTLIAQNNYAVMLLRAERKDRAIGMLRRVVELSGPEGGVVPPGHEQHAMFQSSLGNALMQNGQYEESERLLLSSIATLREKLGDAHFQTRRTAGRLAELYTKLDRPREARMYQELAGM